MSVSKLFVLVIMCLCCFSGKAQDTVSVAQRTRDTIYTSYKSTIYCGVIRNGLYVVRFLLPGDVSGKMHYGYDDDRHIFCNRKAHILSKRDIDSVAFSGGFMKRMKGRYRHGNKQENIPELNTLAFDLAGFSFLSVSMSYERRLKNGKFGFRVPVYIGFVGGGMAGYGMFKPYIPNYNPAFYYFKGVSGGYSVATGLNFKYYPIKKRIFRPFMGPEITMGWSTIQKGIPLFNEPDNFYYNGKLSTYGTFGLLGQLGISLNPNDRFNITFDGGAGIGKEFGPAFNPVGWTGLWHIGFSLGTNF